MPFATHKRKNLHFGENCPFKCTVNAVKDEFKYMYILHLYSTVQKFGVRKIFFKILTSARMQ